MLVYVLRTSIEVDFVLETVVQLMEKHGVSMNDKALIHSDQGCHFTSIKFQELIRYKNFRQSISRRGNDWNNARQEAFFGQIKDYFRIEDCNTFEKLAARGDNYMDYYK